MRVFNYDDNSFDNNNNSFLVKIDPNLIVSECVDINEDGRYASADIKRTIKNHYPILGGHDFAGMLEEKFPRRRSFTEQQLREILDEINFGFELDV